MATASAFSLHSPRSSFLPYSLKTLNLDLPYLSLRKIRFCSSLRSDYSLRHKDGYLMCTKPSKTRIASSNTFSNESQNLGSNNIRDYYLKISRATPLDICKWVGVISVAIAGTKKIVSSLLNPFFWMYFSWTWTFWPWFFAIFVGIYGLYCANKHSKGTANQFEQLVAVNSAFLWLTLVPPAHFNGFLEGWPVVFFFIYNYFFFFNVSIRNRLYGDLYPRFHDSKWDVNLPNSKRILFSVAIMLSHWLAAFEAPPLHHVPGGWSNLAIWITIIVTLFVQYHSSLYLANYSEKVVVPTSVVQFGPYRWVRHPIYASTILLFATYFASLRAPLSLLFMLAICLVYYGQKASLEENLMTEEFGDSYRDYKNKVKYKLIPLIF